ncbi:MAG: peptidylprolyl isomerase [Flavobacteriales bacterium]|nr:peptidylprolyl isomerase [Flavobacteriales bacterium]
MRILLPLFILVSLFTSCTGNGGRTEHRARPPVPQSWGDERLLAVLDAQDHRNTEALCALLKDSSATVRAAAAMAFASVQDSAAASCLITALTDTSTMVRINAAFALGLVADSASLAELNKAADREKEQVAVQSMMEAGFRAELVLRKHDATWFISYLQSRNRDVRTRAMQSLARLPKEELAPVANDILHAASVERDPAVRMFLVGALKSNATKVVTDTLTTLALSDSLPMIRIAALRALGANKNKALATFFLERLNDGDVGVQQTALEQLQGIEGPLDGDAIWKTAQEHADYSIKLPLYGLVMKHGNAQTRMVCSSLMQSLSHQDLGPYWNAALVSALGPTIAQDSLLVLIRSSRPAVERQAALVAWFDAENLALKEINKEAYDRWLAGFMQNVLGTQDAGLIAAVCEKLVEQDPTFLKLLLTEPIVSSLRQALHPIRDLETLQYLDQAIAKRDGLDAPAHKSLPFNHPIDLARLRTLKQGQQYRINTAKGEIILALEPENAPGSCVAFDSLVTAGYYNGKAFHRVIPNFVAQGGCPRGDGYGGMPWTLRTEIGPQGFVEGAVGLASAGHDTESCQFFIMTAAAPHLDGRYTRFAHVVSGIDVAQRLQVGDGMQRVERIP